MKWLGEKVLWRRARDLLSIYNPVVIGVAGSTGKTTTKEAIALALKGERRTRASRHSYDTPLGIALTILGVRAPKTRGGWFTLLTRSLLRELKDEEPEVIIVEIGADRPGDIDWLVKQIPFNLGVITNIGTAHLRLFESIENVSHEHESLVASLPKDGFAILNIDDPLVMKMGKRTRARVVTFSAEQRAHIRLIRAERMKHNGFACEIEVDGQQHELHLRYVIARHQLASVLAAVGVAHVFNLNFSSALKRLQTFEPPNGHMRLTKGINNSQIIDDSYNASPESTVAALDTLRLVSGERKIAVLGDMLDLGSEAVKAHQMVGMVAGEVASMVVVVGDYMKEAGERAASLGADVHRFTNVIEAAAWVPNFIKQGDVVLVKGSREMRMEQIVQRITSGN